MKLKLVFCLDWSQQKCSTTRFWTLHNRFTLLRCVFMILTEKKNKSCLTSVFPLDDTRMSGLRCVCCCTDFACSANVSVLPDSLPSTEAPLSQSETKVPHLSSSSLKSLPLRYDAVYQSQEWRRQEITLWLPRPKPTGCISDNGCSRWKSGKVVRGPTRHSRSRSRTRATLDPKTRDSRITQDHKLYFTIDIHLILESGL